MLRGSTMRLGVLSAGAVGPVLDNSFTQLAKAPRYRGYHSVALLLPDGRVLSAGGDANARNAEIFSPPYLFKGPEADRDRATFKHHI